MIRFYGTELELGVAMLTDLFYPYKGRRLLNHEDKLRWTVKPSDGVNRASIRKEMAQAPREKRLAARAQMTHQQDLEHLKMHPLGGGDEETTIRNENKAARRALR